MGDPRGYSTNLADHQGLMRTMAAKALARLNAVGVYDLDMDDIMSELTIAGLKAQRAYSPEKGFTFTAFLGRCCWNEINKVFDRVAKDRLNFGMTSLEGMLWEQGEHSVDSYLDLHVQEEAVSPEEAVVRLETFRAKLALLTPPTRRYVACLMGRAQRPEEGFREEVANHIRAEIRRVYGIRMQRI